MSSSFLMLRATQRRRVPRNMRFNPQQSKGFVGHGDKRSRVSGMSRHPCDDSPPVKILSSQGYSAILMIFWP